MRKSGVADGSIGYPRASRASRDALIGDYLGFVASLARQLARRLPPCFDLDDLIQTGTLALIHCAARYRPETHGGTPFTAFARQNIRGAMLESVRRRRYREATLPGLEDAPEPAAPQTADAAIDRLRLSARLGRAIGWLTPVERDVVVFYYSAAEPALTEVARALGVSGDRAVRIHAGAIAKLRALLPTRKVWADLQEPETPRLKARRTSTRP